MPRIASERPCVTQIILRSAARRVGYAFTRGVTDPGSLAWARMRSTSPLSSLPRMPERRVRMDRWLTVLACLVTLWAVAGTKSVCAQSEDDLIDRPISEVRIVGLRTVSLQLVENNIRASVGDPYDPELVKSDVATLRRLGKFRAVTGEVELKADGSVAVIYSVSEEAIIAEVQVVGNRSIADQDLLGLLQIVRGVPRDDFLIQQAARAIEARYRERGNYLATVSVDESELNETGVLIFRILEGPRVRIQEIRFQGNDAFNDEQLWGQIKTRTALLFFRRGALEPEILADDVAAISTFYRDRGFIDVRVDRQIDLSPDNAEAIVTFLIAEGPQYTLRRLRAQRLDGSPLVVFAPEQIGAMMEIRPGDVFSQDKMRKSIAIIKEAYGLMGYLDVEVQTFEFRTPDSAQVDLDLEISEGTRYKVGLVEISGNSLTRDRVIRREIRLAPGRPFDATEIDESADRLRRTRLFNDVRITVQEPDPDDPDYRDVLVEVKERNTGSVNFGLAVGSDAGVFGEISLQQSNFDIFDYPESFEEFVTGRAFRGAGQQFNMAFRPGTEIFQYVVSFSEPRLWDSPYSLRLSANLFRRVYSSHDEERASLGFGFGRQLGDLWRISLNGRLEQIELTDIDAFAPTAVFADAGPNVLTGLGISLVRSTIGTIVRPGSGSRLELAVEQVGAMGGDFTFTSLSGEYTVYLTIYEDFLGRKSTLKLNTRAQYILGDDDAPIYERFYLGGRSFRGFDFRTISPKGIRADNGMASTDPIGGQWLFFAGAQYEHPIFQESMAAVVFIDSGTVTDEVGFGDYRVAAGAGIRLYIPQLSQAPLAFDFAIPLLKLDSDETRIFSFSIELPF
jgi:outer membrane protein insertion porin family